VTVLVTGATGFVGSSVVRHLVDSGVDVAIIVRPDSSRRRLDGAIGRLQVLEGDLADGPATARLVERSRPEACIHAAWYAEPGKYLDSPRNLDSLRSSLELLESLIAVGCKHVVGVGTCFEYAMQDTPLQEDSPTAPFTLYAAAKLAFYLVAAQRAAQAGVGLAWARLFYLYGPYEDERRLVPSAIKALSAGRAFPSTSGEQVRDYLHVDDVASALCALSEQKLGGVFNVSSCEPVTIAGLMRTLGELLGRSELIRLGTLPPRDWDPAYVCGDNQKLRTEARWSPRYSLRDGLAQTIEWWKKHS
jgi:nucleoside-diphosphate-sugar epimerase